MHYHFIAEPLMGTPDTLLGVEFLTRFTSDNARVLHPAYVIAGWDIAQKRRFLLNQLVVIRSKQGWFERNGLVCSLKCRC